MIAYASLNIGKKLRQIRELNNLSMARVAGELNISARMYAYIETEHSSVTLERLVDICNIFECTLEQFLGFSEKNIFSVESEHPKSGVKMEKEMVKKLLNSKDELIALLREENKQLRGN